MANKRGADKEQCLEMVALSTHATKHKHLVFPAEHSFVTNIYLKMWYDSFWWQILSQAFKNAHDHIIILWEIKG